MIYVGGSKNVVSSTRDLIYVINPATHSIVTTIPVSFPVGGLAFNPFNQMLYVTQPQESVNDRVTVIDTSTNTPVSNIVVEPAPFGVTVNPSNGIVYVAGEHAAVTVITPSNTVAY